MLTRTTGRSLMICWSARYRDVIIQQHFSTRRQWEEVKQLQLTIKIIPKII